MEEKDRFEPIRVAQVMGKMLYGGTESVVMNYYRHIDRSKIQFDFIADSDSKMPIPRREEIEGLGGRIFIVPPYQRLYEYIPALIKLFKEQNYKIVHAHINTLNVFPLFAAKRAGVPVRISHNHSTAGKGEIKKNILKYMLRPWAKLYPTHYAACSKYAGEWLFGKKAMDNGKVTIFNNAIDMDKFRFSEKTRDEVRKELGLEGKYVIGHVGRFCYQKNQEFLIDIFTEVYKREPNAVLLLIGDGEDFLKIKEKVNNLRVGGGIKILSNRVDIECMYQAMDIFIFPSRYEGLGLAAIEAQASGLRVIASTLVPLEAKISDNIDYLKLTEKKMWIEMILKEYKNDQKRVILNVQMLNNYDIKEQSEKLWKYYWRRLNG